MTASLAAAAYLASGCRGSGGSSRTLSTSADNMHKFVVDYLRQKDGNELSTVYDAAVLDGDIAYTPSVRLKTKEEKRVEPVVFVYTKGGNIFGRVYFNGNVPYKVNLEPVERIKLITSKKIKDVGEKAKKKAEEVADRLAPRKRGEEIPWWHPSRWSATKKPQAKRAENAPERGRIPIHSFSYNPSQADELIMEYMVEPKNQGWLDSASDWLRESAVGELAGYGKVDPGALVERFQKQRAEREAVYVQKPGRKDVLDVVVDESTVLGDVNVEQGRAVKFTPSRGHYWNYVQPDSEGAKKPFTDRFEDFGDKTQKAAEKGAEKTENAGETAMKLLRRIH